MTDPATARADTSPRPPQLHAARLFLVFLRFGALAWGGPVAQISMLREQLVERDRWVDGQRFNRVLGVYQALPGPEATELCIWFGQRARGRLGGVVAGLGFVLPGFLLMLALTWAYVSAGPFDGRTLAALLAMQVAAVALVARGAWKIASRSLPDRMTVAVAAAAGGATLVGVHFAVVLLAAGLALEIARRWRAGGVALIALAALATIALGISDPPQLRPDRAVQASGSAQAGEASLQDVGVSGLRAGSLTFGGAYTVIPFLQHDAVEQDEWLTAGELLQGLALASVVPAPLIIFATFVGWLAGGLAGAIVMTVAIFLPAFVITLAGHATLERIVDNRRVHDFLDGVMAGVVGLIAVTALILTLSLVDSIELAAVLALAAAALWRWNASLAIPAVMLGSAVVGALIV